MFDRGHLTEGILSHMPEGYAEKHSRIYFLWNAFCTSVIAFMNFM